MTFRVLWRSSSFKPQIPLLPHLHYTMSNNYTRVTRSDGGGKFMIFVVWIVLSGALVLVLLPCCIYRRFRIIYCRRIRQRRWNVSTDDIEPDPRPFMRRYPRSDPRHVASAEDAEHAKKEYILGKLKDFTKVWKFCFCRCYFIFLKPDARSTLYFNDRIASLFARRCLHLVFFKYGANRR